MKIWLRAALSIAAFLLAAYFSQTSIVQHLELSTADIWTRFRGKIEPPSNLVIVAIDEPSYRDLKVPFTQVWPRRLHAKLLERLLELGASRVAFDVIFADQGADPAADDAFATAISKIPTVLGVERSLQQISGPAGSYLIEEWIEPYEPFRTAAEATALVSLPSDGEVCRHFPSVPLGSNRRVATLSEATAGFLDDTNRARPNVRDLINYYGPARTLPIISFWEVIQESLPFPDTLIRGKTVLVGFALRSDTGAAQKDSYSSPFGGAPIYGVEVHGTAALNLQHEDWISRPSALREALGNGAVIGALTFLALSLPPLIFGVVVAALALGWSALAFWLWTNGFFLVGVFAAVIVAPLLLLSSALYFYLVVRRSERTIRSAFELYVSPDMAPKLGDPGYEIKLGGEKLWATALFTDIQDFTAIAEELPAERTSEMLNAYFTEVVEVIFQNQGTLLKFIGDAVFALWGAPIKVSNHSECAVRTALQISQAVDRFNQSGRFPRLTTRIGIHTGPMVVGNLGSARRFDYTAIGDSVNLASRVEGLNKYFGTTILFTDSTKRDASTSINPVPVGEVRVKGRREVVSLYTVFEPEADGSVIAEWKSALNDFGERRFDDARKLFERVQTLDSRLEPAAKLYISYCATFSQNAPAPSWGGEIEFDK